MLPEKGDVLKFGYAKINHRSPRIFPFLGLRSG